MDDTIDQTQKEEELVLKIEEDSGIIDTQPEESKQEEEDQQIDSTKEVIVDNQEPQKSSLSPYHKYVPLPLSLIEDNPDRSEDKPEIKNEIKAYGYQ